MIEVFWNLLAGMEEQEQEWEKYQARENKSPDEEEILNMLNLCLKFIDEKMSKMGEEWDLERQMLIEDRNRNIEELQRLAKEYEEHRGLLDRYNEEMSRGEQTLKDTIEALKAENAEIKLTISGLTNTLAQALQWSGAEMEDQEHQALVLNRHIEGLLAEHNRNRAENKALKEQLAQLENNYNLLLKKLEEASRSKAELDSQLRKRISQHEEEAAQLRDHADGLERQINAINVEMATTSSNSGNKDNQITELNRKIGELNDELSSLLNNHQKVELELHHRTKAEEAKTRECQ
jgi:chromosome segregation ATPase